MNNKTLILHIAAQLGVRAELVVDGEQMSDTKWIKAHQQTTHEREQAEADCRFMRVENEVQK